MCLSGSSPCHSVSFEPAAIKRMLFQLVCVVWQIGQCDADKDLQWCVSWSAQPPDCTAFCFSLCVLDPLTYAAGERRFATLSDEEDSDSDNSMQQKVVQKVVKSLQRPVATVTNALRIWQHSAEWVQFASDAMGATEMDSDPIGST